MRREGPSERDSPGYRARAWPYLIVFALGVTGCYKGYRYQADYREAARTATDSLDIEFEDDLAAELVTLRTCLDKGVCPEPNALGMAPGGAYNENWFDDWWSVSLRIWPELKGFHSAAVEWNSIVRDATTADGEITDTAALTELVDGTRHAELSDELVRARVELADRAERNRRLSRWAGWAWAACLAVMITLPIAMSVLEERRKRRLVRNDRFAMELRRQPAAMIVSASNASPTGTSGTTSTPSGPSSTNVS